MPCHFDSKTIEVSMLLVRETQTWANILHSIFMDWLCENFPKQELVFFSEALVSWYIYYL